MKRLFLFLSVCLVSIHLLAIEVVIDGINYGLSTTNRTAYVTTYYDYMHVNRYSGNVTIPETVVYEGYIYTVTRIGASAFSNCVALQSVILPNTITQIGGGAFGGCTSLTQITLPNTVTYIEAGAFENCSNLMFVQLSENLISLGGGAFNGCTNMQNITLPNTLTEIGASAFTDCRTLTQIIIPNSVKTIGESAFSGCTHLTEVILSDSISCIERWTFSNCSNLTNITIPSSVRVIKNPAFANTNLQRVNITDVAAWCGISFDSYFTNPLFIAQHLYLNNEEATDIVIPEGVTEIKSYAFMGCKNIRSVHIPSSLSIIGAYAFDCDSLEQVHITDLSAWCKITFRIEGDEESVQSVASNPLCCGHYLYLNGEELTNLVIPDDVTTIKMGAFNACYSLQHITIPSSVTNIANYAFMDCENLESLILPNTVTNIGISAFKNATLTDITCPAIVPPTCAANVFTNFNAALHIPCDAQNNYRTAAYWGLFRNVVCLPSYSISVVSNDETKGTVTGTGFYAEYTSLQITATPQYGHRFVQWNDGVTDNPRTVTVYSDSSLVAEFIPLQYTIQAMSDNPIQGTVEVQGGNGNLFDYGTIATLVAIPKTGYEFTHWQDGNTDNPRTIQVNCNFSITASFGVQYLTIQTSSDPSQGSVTGGGTYVYGETAVLWARPATGYRFKQWHDGNTDNPRTISVTQNSTYTAEFSTQIYTITVSVNDTTLGTVTGGGEYAYNTNAVLTAIPAMNCEFVRWNDGITAASRIITVKHDATYTAQFQKKQFTLTTMSNNAQMGVVTGAGTYDYGTLIVVQAVANEGYEFVQWSDGNTDNPRVVTVTKNETFIAQFAALKYTLTVLSQDMTMGNVSGGGEYSYGSKAILTATAKEGYEFVQWTDGSTDNPHNVTITNDAIYIAAFAEIQSGLENTLSAQVSIVGGNIICETPFRVYSLTGQDVTAQNGNLISGMYIVKTVNESVKVLIP